MHNTTNENILEVTGLTKRFGGLVAVDNVDITVKKREIHALIGPNGAGKTTTLSMINGTLNPTEGSILFDGEDITKKSTDIVAKMGMGGRSRTSSSSLRSRSWKTSCSAASATTPRAACSAFY